MNFGFLGIQFGFALRNANVSRIFETLGAKVDSIPILWIAFPVTGLIMQPIFSYLRDKNWGRRGSFFMLSALLASLALLVMPNSPSLWIAAGMLWIMSGSINISMEPFHSFVGYSLPSERRTRGLAMQSFFIGLGAVIASGLPYMLSEWLGVANVAEAGEKIPPSVRVAFYLGGTVFFLSLCWTIFRIKEYPTDQLKEFTEENIQSHGMSHFIYRTSVELLKSFFQQGFIWLVVGVLFSSLIFLQGWEKELYVISVSLAVYGLIHLITAWNTRQGLTRNGLVEVMTDMMNMPKTMKQLAVVQFFSWFALFAMWIYSTSAVTSHIYGTSDTTTELYNKGANWVGFLFAIYNGFAALMAFVLPVLAKATSRKMAHAISLVIGGIGLMSFYVIKDPNLLLISMVGVGIACASILSMPYAILTDALPAGKMRIYRRFFNLFIVIPQIFAASILGLLTKSLFGGHAIYVLVLGGISLLIAAVSVLFVDDIDPR